MKWVGISGSWRDSCPKLEQDIEREVNRILDNSNGIVTGGALGVDYLATAAALRRFPDGNRVRVILPTSLETYIAHYEKRADEGVITHAQAKALIAQLKTLNTHHALIENSTVKEVNTETYYVRNSAVVAASDELIAFHVNQSKGTRDTIERALKKNISVHVFNYTVNPKK